MGKKRGVKAQASIFIIISIVIAAAVAFFFVIYSNDSIKEIFSNENSYPPRVQEVYDSVEECLDETLQNVIVLNSLQGGYYITPDPATYHDDKDIEKIRVIPHYLDNRKYVPSEDTLNSQIEQGISYEIENCLEPKENFDIPVRYDLSGIRVRSSVSDGKVSVEMDFPVEVEFENEDLILKDFSSDIETNYKSLWEAGVEVTEIQIRYGDEICLTCLDEISKKSKVTFSNEETFLDDNRYLVIYNVNKYDSRKELNETFVFAHLFYKNE